MANYYGKIKKVWDELQAKEGVSICTYGAYNQCFCSLLKRMVEKEGTLKLMQFLMGLSDAFEYVRSNILLMDSLPTINHAFHMVLQIERQKEIIGNENVSHDALVVNRFGNNARQN